MGRCGQGGYEIIDPCAKIKIILILLSSKEKYEKYKPKKFLGQNFLVDNNIARKIISSLGIQKGDNVLEIGPGHGALTKFLVQEDCNYIAVELDKSIYEKLSSEYGERIKLLHKDFLKIDYKKDLKPLLTKKKIFKIIGNIPYNITSEILFKIFDMNEYVSETIFMMQKEVAKRLTAKPDTKDYGILAVQTQFNTDVKILFSVPPTAFFPKPRVHSAVVKLKLKKNPQLKNGGMFTKIVRNAFGQRRKVMRNSLKIFFNENDLEFEKIDFDFSRRPENVSVDEFVTLSNEISKALDDRKN